MNPNEELITRWIDGELDSSGQAEFEALLASDPEFAKQAKADAEALGVELRRELPASLDPPYPDFFNSQIQKRIREGDAAMATGAATAGGSSVLSWLKSPFTIGAAAAACAVLLLTRGGDPSGAVSPIVVSTYAPDPAVSVTSAGYNEEAGATVILLTGLARIPDAVEVGGQNVATYVPAGPRGFGRFYTEDAKLAYVLETDADGAPSFFARGTEL